MKRSEIITVSLPQSTDAFAALARLKGLKSIKGVYVITCQSIKVKYNGRKVKTKDILEAVNGYIPNVPALCNS